MQIPKVMQFVLGEKHSDKYLRNIVKQLFYVYLIISTWTFLPNYSSSGLLPGCQGSYVLPGYPRTSLLTGYFLPANRLQPGHPLPGYPSTCLLTRYILPANRPQYKTKMTYYMWYCIKP